MGKTPAAQPELAQPDPHLQAVPAQQSAQPQRHTAQRQMAEYQTKTTIVARMALVMVTGVWFFGVGVQAMVQRADRLRGHILGHRDWMVVGVMPLQRVSRRGFGCSEGSVTCFATGH